MEFYSSFISFMYLGLLIRGGGTRDPLISLLLQRSQPLLLLTALATQLALQKPEHKRGRVWHKSDRGKKK